MLLLRSAARSVEVGESFQQCSMCTSESECKDLDDDGSDSVDSRILNELMAGGIFGSAVLLMSRSLDEEFPTRPRTPGDV